MNSFAELSQTLPRRMALLTLAAALVLPALILHTQTLHLFTVSQAFSTTLLAWLPLLFLHLRKTHNSIKIFSTGPALVSSLLIFTGWILLASVFSSRIDLSAQWAWALALVFPVFSVTWFFSGERADRRRLLAAIVLATTLMGLYGLIQLVGLDPMPWSATFDGRPGSFLGNPNFFAGHLVLILPAALALALQDRHKSLFIKVIHWIAFGLLAVLLGATQTRGAWLAALASFSLFFFISARAMPGLLTRNRKGLLGVSILLVAAAALGLARHPQVLDRLLSLNPVAESSVGKRLVLMTNTLKLANQHPLFGAGPGQLRLHYPRVQAADLKGDQIRTRPYILSSHAHNDYVQLAAESGIPAALAWAAFWFLLISSCLKSPLLQPARHVERDDSSQHESLLLLGLLCGLAGLQVHAMSNFPMLIPPTLITAMAMAGMAWRLARPLKAGPQTPANPWRRVFALASLVFLAWIGGQRGRDIAMEQLWYKAQGEFALGNTELAAPFAASALKLVQNEDRLWHLQGKIQAANGQTTQSVGSLQAAVNLNPYDALARVDLARQLMLQGDYARVTSVLEPLWKTAPNLNGWWEMAGAAAFNQGKWQQCADAYGQAVFFGENTQVCLVNQASCLGNLQKYAEAVTSLNAALKTNPNDTRALFAKAVTYYKMDLKDFALDQLNRLLAIEPANRDALHYKGLIEKEIK